MTEIFFQSSHSSTTFSVQVMLCDYPPISGSVDLPMPHFIE